VSGRPAGARSSDNWGRRSEDGPSEEICLEEAIGEAGEYLAVALCSLHESLLLVRVDDRLLGDLHVRGAPLDREVQLWIDPDDHHPVSNGTNSENRIELGDALKARQLQLQSAAGVAHLARVAREGSDGHIELPRRATEHHGERRPALHIPRDSPRVVPRGERVDDDLA